jgi:hypothetical protein
MKLTTHLQIVLRSRMVELYLHYPVCFHDVVLNYQAEGQVDFYELIYKRKSDSSGKRKRTKKITNESSVIYAPCFSPHIRIVCRTMRLVGYLERMGEMRNPYKIIMGNSESKTLIWVLML